MCSTGIFRFSFFQVTLRLFLWENPGAKWEGSGSSQVRLKGNVILCFELLKPSSGAANMPGCASQRRLVEMHFPGGAALPPSSTHKASSVVTAEC